MRWELDRYSHLDSPLHHWDPRAKVVGLAGLMVAFAALQHLPLVVPMIVTAAAIYGLSRLPISYLVQRLRYPGLLILSLVVMLPLVSGETVLWHWGWLTLRQEGLERMVVVIGRFVSILTLSFVLLGTTPFVTLLRSMRSLGLPALMADMMMLSYRYLFEVGDTLATMRQAMKLRGFQLYRHQPGWIWPDLAAIAHVSALLGTLLLRSYDRSEQVYKAMKLRGYGQQVGSRSIKSWPDPWSCLGMGLALAWGVGFVLLEHVWL